MRPINKEERKEVYAALKSVLDLSLIHISEPTRH